MLNHDTEISHAKRPSAPEVHSAQSDMVRTNQKVAAGQRIAASWQRSEEYGVSPESVEPAWSDAIVNDTLFYQCGQEVLLGLQSTLMGEPISLMLADANGLVLNRFSGDQSLLRALDRVHLAPGFAYSERDAGTNALGLALADRTSTLVHAEDHFSASLRGYTCAAVPVLDPASGQLEGSVNITTWSRSSPELLLALAQSAANNTTALMQVRSAGGQPRATPRGGVFRVQRSRLEPGAGSLRSLSNDWESALDHATLALRRREVVAVVGEAGSGRATLLAQALRRAHPRSRILCASAPEPDDIETWLTVWVPELVKADTAVIVENADALPAWGAQLIYGRVAAAMQAVGSSPESGPGILWALTATKLTEVPPALSAMIEVVVSISPLRERTSDILPLAHFAAHKTRLRDLEITRGAVQVLQGYAWPGNVDELFNVIQEAALKTEVIDVQHLPPNLFTTSRRQLTRIESVERDEIIRCLAKPGTTIPQAALELGLSRATIYRRISRLGINVPRGH